MNGQAASRELSADDFCAAIESAKPPLEHIAMGVIDVYVAAGMAGSARTILVGAEGRYMELTLH